MNGWISDSNWESHDQVYQEDGHGDGQQHASRSDGHLPVLSAQVDAEVIGKVHSAPDAPACRPPRCPGRRRSDWPVTRATRCWSILRISLGPSSQLDPGYGAELDRAAFLRCGRDEFRARSTRIPYLPARSPPSVCSFCPVFLLSPEFTAMAFSWGDLFPVHFPRPYQDIYFCARPAENRVATLPRTLFRIASAASPMSHTQGRHPITVEYDHGLRDSPLPSGTRTSLRPSRSSRTSTTSLLTPRRSLRLKPRISTSSGGLETEQRRPDELDPGIGEYRPGRCRSLSMTGSLPRP